MNRKIIICLLTTALVSTAPFAAAQQAKNVYRIGVLRSQTPSLTASQHEAFRQGLRELGYVEGHNIVLEIRWAEGKSDRLPHLAAELARLKVDVILVGGTAATSAAKKATSTIPIVVGTAGDLVGAGLVASLARPGGNVTGSTLSSPDVSGKRLELLGELIPKASRVAVIFGPRPGDWDEFRETERAAGGLGVKVQPVQLQDPAEFQNAYAAMMKQQAKAIIIIMGNFTNAHIKQLVELATKGRLPSMCETSRWTDRGCLVSYGPELLHMWRRAATYVDKILKGRKPPDLPVEQPTKYELIINLKTAKQIGLTIPQSVLYRADKVIK